MHEHAMHTTREARTLYDSAATYSVATTAAVGCGARRCSVAMAWGMGRSRVVEVEDGQRVDARVRQPVRTAKPPRTSRLSQPKDL